jgi:hypothetical protein
MSNQPSKEIVKEISDAKTDLQILQNEWQEILEDLKNAKEETKTKEIFAVMDYLTFCDQLRKAIYNDIDDFDIQINYFSQLKKKLEQEKANTQLIDELLDEMQKFRAIRYDKMVNIDDDYLQLSDHSLRVAQDLITTFSDRMQREKVTPTMMNEIKQGLEKELFLQELMDTLETYREAREDYISELIMESLQRLPDDQIPEDLGEEDPEIDAVLSQLDMAITSCEAALLDKEIQE